MAKADRFFSLGRGRYFDTVADKEVSRYARDKIVRGNKTTRRISNPSRNRVRKSRAHIRVSREEHRLLLKDRQRYLEYSTGKKIPLHEIEKSADFKKILADLKTKSKTARGPKARALVKLGRRDPNWSSQVGESNPLTQTKFETDAFTQLRLSEKDVRAMDIEKEIAVKERERQDLRERRKNRGRVRR